jgi:Tfp pilus assembly protein PilW
MTPRPHPASRATCPAESGASLVELLVAVALLSLALGTVAMLATAVLAGFEADPAAADEQQRARSGISALVDDVQRAGSGFVQSPDEAPGSGLPSLVPDVVAPGTWATRAVPHTLTTVHGRRGAAHATLRAPAAAGDVWIRLARPAFCSAVSVSCGFAAGDDLIRLARPATT